MAGEDYGAATLRHLKDCDLLAAEERWGGAGHLVGFAAECAIKYRIASLRPEQDAPKGHFPDLANIAKKHLTGRRDVTLLAILKLPDMMAGWKVELRYAGDSAVGPKEFALWRSHAVRLIGATDLRKTC